MDQPKEFSRRELVGTLRPFNELVELDPSILRTERPPRHLISAGSSLTTSTFLREELSRVSGFVL